jgi:hypothetical protein
VVCASITCTPAKIRSASIIANFLIVCVFNE